MSHPLRSSASMSLASTSLATPSTTPPRLTVSAADTRSLLADVADRLESQGLGADGDFDLNEHVLGVWVLWPGTPDNGEDESEVRIGDDTVGRFIAFKQADERWTCELPPKCGSEADSKCDAWVDVGFKVADEDGWTVVSRASTFS
ncbi:hypothetical protein Q5752_006068 [Cryptotrichosporon argae]